MTPDDPSPEQPPEQAPTRAPAADTLQEPFAWPEPRHLTLTQDAMIKLPAGTMVYLYPAVPPGGKPEDWFWHVAWTNPQEGSGGDDYGNAAVVDQDWVDTVHGSPLSPKVFTPVMNDTARRMRQPCAPCNAKKGNGPTRGELTPRP